MIVNPGSRKLFSVEMYVIAGVSVGVCVFFLSLLVSPYYISGDQKYYIEAYNGISDLSLAEGFAFYNVSLSSTEIIHYLIIWLASGFGIEKNFVMAASNAFFAYLAMKLFQKLRSSVFVAMAIVLTNFYMIVMYFAAERLKFGFIFLVISVLCLGRRKRFYASAVLAVFSHVQILLIYASIFFAQMVKDAARLIQTLRFSFGRIILPVIMLGPLAFLIGHIYSKFEFYSAAASEKDIFDLIRIILFLILSMWYSKNKYEAFLLFVPMILAVFFVGSDRVNMMAYFVFLYYGLQYKGGLNFGVLATTIYFALKSYGFIVDVIKYGDGFENVLSLFHVFSRSIYA